MKKNTIRRFGALVVGLSLLAGACGSDDDAATEEAVTEETTAEVVDAAGSELSGMKGTTPLVELTPEFKDAVNAFWTGKGNEALTDFNYTAESFDAVLLIALQQKQQAQTAAHLLTRLLLFQKKAQSARQLPGQIALQLSRQREMLTLMVSQDQTQ